MVIIKLYKKRRKSTECYCLKALDCPDDVTNNSSRLVRYITLGYIQPLRERSCLLSIISELSRFSNRIISLNAHIKNVCPSFRNDCKCSDYFYKSKLKRGNLHFTYSHKINDLQ